MPLGPQPRGRRGTIGHPYTALNLRLALAISGFVSCVALAVVLWWLLHLIVLASVALFFALVALVDAVVVQLRRRQRKRAEGKGHSIFE